MTEKFKFVRTDPLVLRLLQKAGIDIDTVKTWQDSDSYVFEFHGGHHTGHPIYIRPKEDSRDGANIPKINTRNKTANSYKTVEDVEGGIKLRVLSGAEQRKLMRLIADEWEVFSALALEYWKDHLY